MINNEPIWGYKLSMYPPPKWHGPMGCMFSPMASALTPGDTMNYQGRINYHTLGDTYVNVTLAHALKSMLIIANVAD